MSVIVKGMEMPKNCIECPLHDGEYGVCNILIMTIDDCIPKECPLVEVEVVRCKDCKHRPYEGEDGYVHEPDWGDFTCPYLCGDSYYSGIPEDDFFCKYGERRCNG